MPSDVSLNQLIPKELRPSGLRNGAASAAAMDNRKRLDLAARLGNELLPVLQRTFTENKSTNMRIALRVDVDFQLFISACENLSWNHKRQSYHPGALTMRNCR